MEIKFKSFHPSKLNLQMQFTVSFNLYKTKATVKDMLRTKVQISENIYAHFDRGLLNYMPFTSDTNFDLAGRKKLAKK